MQIPNIDVQTRKTQVPDSLADLDRGWKATLLGLVLFLSQVLLLPLL